MSTEADSVVRFHMSLNVSDLAKSVQFFQVLFGLEPAKLRSDYAKFELNDPPLVLSLEPRTSGPGGALNHAGFRFADAEQLMAAHKRLDAAGIHAPFEEEVECCYAKQMKFWVRDPDGGLWEFYVLQGNIDHRGAGQALDVIPISSGAKAAERSWEHRMGSPLAIPGEFGDESLDEVRLRGSFNVPTGPDDMLRFLKEVRAALRPDGNLFLHILTGDAPLSEVPQLPGGAAVVKHVPVRDELLSALDAAGFVDIQLTTFRPKACFEQEGVSLRETKITCRRPTVACDATCAVVYKGPFAEVTDDEGHVWQRGRKTTIPLARWEAIERTPLVEMFVRLPSEALVGACST